MHHPRPPPHEFLIETGINNNVEQKTSLSRWPVRKDVATSSILIVVLLKIDALFQQILACAFFKQNYIGRTN